MDIHCRSDWCHNYGVDFLIDWELEWALLIILFGPIITYVSSWLLYAFGQLVEDTRYITNQNTVIARSVKIISQQIIDEVKKKRNAEDDAKREAEEKTKHHSEEKKNGVLLQTSRAVDRPHFHYTTKEFLFLHQRLTFSEPRV